MAGETVKRNDEVCNLLAYFVKEGKTNTFPMHPTDLMSVNTKMRLVWFDWMGEICDRKELGAVLYEDRDRFVKEVDEALDLTGGRKFSIHPNKSICLAYRWANIPKLSDPRDEYETRAGMYGEDWVDLCEVFYGNKYIITVEERASFGADLICDWLRVPHIVTTNELERALISVCLMSATY